MRIDHRLLGPSFAAEVSDVDMSSPPSPELVDAVRALWMEHKVIVFRGQSLEETAMLEFTRPFGRLFVHIRSQFHSRKHPEVMVLTNAVPYDEMRGAVGDNSDLAWHSDQAYTACPVWGTMLHAVELPREGGATSFADLAQAQSAMPADLAARVAGRRTCFSISGATATMKQSVSDEQRQAAPDVSHPVLRRHPFLDRSILYVSPAHATGIEGMDSEEGRALLDELASWASRPEFVYSHVWQPGDVVMWDNVQTMHRRDPFPAGEVRTMIRTGFHLPDGYGAPMAV